MRTTLYVLSFCLFAGFASIALAQTPDGDPPAVEEDCALESGAAFGLCNAYCEAMDCDCPTADNPECEPQASDRACTRVRDRFLQVTGRELPCDVAVDPDPEPEACPCVGFAAGWADPNFVSGNWDIFQGSLFSAGTTCTDDGSRIDLEDPVGDFGMGSATVAADATMLRCELSMDISGSASYPNLTPGQALGCRQVLLDAWEAVNGVGSCL